MHTESKKNETNQKIANTYRNDGSKIAGSAHVVGCTKCSGCMSSVTQNELKPVIEQMGKLIAATGLDPCSVRLKKPIAAIREAKRRAVIWGFSVADVISEDGLPYDFVAMKDGITSFVCVRRVNLSWFNIDMIATRCRKQIDAFRSMNMQQGLVFEIWVRGYARAFFRYRVLPDRIEETGIVLEPETRAGKKALDDAMMNVAPQGRTDEKIVGGISSTT